ncbi:MAG: hypothetical protein WKF40_02460 [Thermoleophilaceae bacterium]
MDGKSAFSKAVRDRTEFKMLRRDLSGWIRMPEARFAQLKQAAIDRRIDKFGEGDDRRPLLPDRPQPAAARPAGPVRGKLAVQGEAVGAGRLRRRRSRRAPRFRSWVTGRVSGGSGPPKDIAVSVNGTVRAVGNTFQLANGGGELMGVLVPETSFKKGANKVEVFEVQGGRLLKMGGT